MRSSLRLGFTLTLAGLGVLLASFSFRAAEPPNGAALYKQRCSVCHGVHGKGFPAIKTPDFTDPKWQTSVRDKDILEITKNGKKGTTMPAFADKLKDEEIRAVVAHLRALNSKKR